MGYRIDTPHEVELDAEKILEHIQKYFIDASHKTGFRGHQRASWSLKPTLTRYIEKLEKAQRLGSRTATSYAGIQRDLYKLFRDTVLINEDLPRDRIDKVDLWQFGQHHGLPTPLLDWTHSPYVGLFFALIEPGDGDFEGHSEPRCLWALDLDLLAIINQQIRECIRPRFAHQILDREKLEEQFPEMHIISNIDGYNRRLAYQQGFFTRHVFYNSFEVWAKRIAENISHESFDTPLITKCFFAASSEQRYRLLRILTKMNINSRVLFPDIKGSVDYARLSIEHRLLPKPKSFGATRDASR